MKKVFTLKNCLIILFLLSVATFFAISTIQEFDNINTFNNFLNDNDGFADMYVLEIKCAIAIIITDFIISSFILTFTVLFCISHFKHISILKFAFITLLFVCFATYMLQIALLWFIQLNQNTILTTGYVAKAISALIALLISIACYVYLLLREIKQRKTATTNEPVAETLEPIQEIAATNSTNNEPNQQNTTEQE